MDKLLTFFSVFLIFGCIGCSNLLNKVSETTISQASVSQISKVEEGCPKEGGKLNPSDVQEIAIENEPIDLSGQLKAAEYKGYTFEGKPGQKLSYNTKDDICIWIYDPESRIIEGLELKQNGKYIVEISVPSGMATYAINIGLQNPEPPQQISSSSVNYITNQSTNTNYSPSTNTNSSNTQSNYTSSSSVSFSRERAVELIKKWQNAKRTIFAPPFDRQLGYQLLTGKALADNIRKPDGSGSSVDWLENNNAYYTYGLQEIDSVEKFETYSDGVAIELVLSEQRTLCLNGRPHNDSNTAFDKRLVRYDLQPENGQWKLANYRTIKVISKNKNPDKICRI